MRTRRRRSARRRRTAKMSACGRQRRRRRGACGEQIVPPCPPPRPRARRAPCAQFFTPPHPHPPPPFPRSALLKQKLELQKDLAEREAKAKGSVGEETRAQLRYLQDLYDGKNPPPPPTDFPKEVAAKVEGLTTQKLDAIGRTAGEIIVKLCDNVVKDPANPKLRRVPFFKGKPVFDRVAPSAMGFPLLTLLGWERVAAPDGSGDFLELSEEKAAANKEFLAMAVALINQAIAAGKFERK